MSKTKKSSRGWLPPRTGGYIPTQGNDTTAIRSVNGGSAAAPKGGGGVGNIHHKKRDGEDEAE